MPWFALLIGTANLGAAICLSIFWLEAATSRICTGRPPLAAIVVLAVIGWTRIVCNT